MRKLYEAASEPPTPVKSSGASLSSRKSSNASYADMNNGGSSVSAASTPLKEKAFLSSDFYDQNQIELDTHDGSERPQWLRLVGRLKSASMSCLSEAGGRLMSPSNSPISPHVPMSPQVWLIFFSPMKLTLQTSTIFDSFKIEVCQFKLWSLDLVLTTKLRSYELRNLMLTFIHETQQSD